MNNAPNVKQLEWEHIFFDGGEEWLAFPMKCCLKYNIVKYRHNHSFKLYINSSLKNKEDDLWDAKYEAQADFENKIRGCLS